MSQPRRRLGVKLCAKTVSATDSFFVAAAAPVFSFVAIGALRFWPGRWLEVSEKIRYLKRSCSSMSLFDKLQMIAAGYSNVGELLEMKLTFASQKLQLAVVVFSILEMTWAVQ